ncbi:MAG TPA: ABC transporter permease [Gemmatimonadaceae bacterium]|jgi:predicted permease
MRRVFRLPFGRANIAREVDDELAFHLDMRVQRLMAAGMSPDAARREALRQFGNVDTVRQDCVSMDEQRERAMSRANVWDELIQDVAYALRTLRRNPGFTAVIVLALALGIGANTAIFTLIDAVVVRGLPVSHPEQLVAVGDTRRVSSLSQGAPRTDLISYPLYRDIREHFDSFSGVLASGRVDRMDVTIGSSGTGAEHPRGRYVSDNYFSVLGLPAFLGRTFAGTEDAVPGGSPVAVISYGYWITRFHGDRSAVGSTMSINNMQTTIIGVGPEQFTGEIVGATTDVWVPLSMHDALNPNQHLLKSRSADWLLLLGRMKPGVTLAQTKAALTPFIIRDIVTNAPGQIGQAFQAGDKTVYISDGSRGFSRVRGTFKAPLFTLMCGVLLLLCIICGNVANLLLARAVARGREMAVRLALGADRRRLVRQMLTESVVLALLGAALGLLVAWWGSHGLLLLAADGPNIPLSLSLDWRVMAFTLATSIGAVLLFGLAPALRGSRVELATTMRSSAQSVAGSALGQRGQRMPIGKLLIAAQVSLSVVLLVGAGMLVHSLWNVQNQDMGLDRDHLIIVDVDVNAHGYTGARLAELAHSVRDRVATVPGVSAVTFSENGIFSGTESSTTIELPGFTMRAPSDSEVAYDEVGPNYVHAIGGRLIGGRDIMTSDEAEPERVAVVNESLANFYFPHENAVGKFLHFNDSLAVEIVGIVADTRDHSLDEAPRRRAYFSFVHTDTALSYPGSLSFEVRTQGDPAALVQQVRGAIRAVNPTLPIDSAIPLTTLMRQAIREQRLVANLASGFGALALLLAAIGLYGVMTYAITRRTGEIGLRVALGAQQHEVVTMVLFDALRLVAAGLVVGLLLTGASTRLLQAQLHGVSAIDPVSIAAAVIVLAASAVAAVLVPAMRASRVSPIVALRAD